VIRSTALLLLMTSWSLSARAQAPQDEVIAPPHEQQLTQTAISAFVRQDYRSAVALFEQATVSAPSLTARVYLARSRAALGQLVEAAADYRSAISGVQPSESDSGERLMVASARDELAQLRPRIPSIEVTLGDAEQRSRNLRLVMDGHLIPVNSVVAADPGHHEVVASDVDGEQARLTFELGEGESKTVGMAWRSPAGRANKKPEDIVGGSPARRAWGVVALGVGATGLGVGTVTGIAALSRYSAAEAHCPANRCTEGAPYPEDGSAFRTLRTISVAGYIVGAAGIGTWLGLLLTTPTTTSEHPKVSPWTPVVGMGSAGARYVF